MFGKNAKCLQGHAILELCIRNYWGVFFNYEICYRMMVVKSMEVVQNIFIIMYGFLLLGLEVHKGEKH